jgi:hypothetical protein
MQIHQKGEGRADTEIIDSEIIDNASALSSSESA